MAISCFQDPQSGVYTDMKTKTLFTDRLHRYHFCLLRSRLSWNTVLEVWCAVSYTLPVQPWSFFKNWLRWESWKKRVLHSLLHQLIQSNDHESLFSTLLISSNRTGLSSASKVGEVKLRYCCTPAIPGQYVQYTILHCYDEESIKFSVWVASYWYTPSMYLAPGGSTNCQPETFYHWFSYLERHAGKSSPSNPKT